MKLEKFVNQLYNTFMKNNIPNFLFKPIRELTYVVLDLETTGFKPGPAAVTEIAAIRIENGVEVARLDTLVDPQMPVPPEITNITGISNAMVRGKKKFFELLPEIEKIFENAIFVSHNVPFDWSFFDYFYRLHLNRPLDMPSLCTLKMSRKLLSLPSNKLEKVAKYFNVSLVGAHRATNDTLAVKGILEAFIDKLEKEGVRTGDDLYKKGLLCIDFPGERI